MKRLLSLVAVLGLVALMLAATAGAAFALMRPSIAARCSDVAGQYNWNVDLYGSNVPNYFLQWSANGTDWSDPIDWSVGNGTIGSGGYSGILTTPSTGGNSLWVRWASTPANVAGPVVNTEGRCTPLPTDTPKPLFQKVIVGGTATLSDFTFQITQGTNVTTIPGSALDVNGVYHATPPVGDYIITETPVANYAASYDNGGLVKSTNCHSVVSVDLGTAYEPILCVITNTYVQPPVSCTVANNCRVNTPAPSVSPSPSPSPSPSASPSPSPVVTPSPTPVVSPTRTPNGGNVGGATGMTPPPTNAIGASATGSDSPLVPLSIALLCAAMAGLLLVRRPKFL